MLGMMRSTSRTTRACSSRASIRIAEKSSFRKSRISFATRLSSWWITAGARNDSMWPRISDQSSWK